jgi:hypothetical protein
MIKEVSSVRVSVRAHSHLSQARLIRNEDGHLRCFEILNGKCRGDTKGEHAFVKQGRVLQILFQCLKVY